MLLLRELTWLLGDIGKDWNYFRFSPDRDIRVIDLGENQYTVAIMVGIESIVNPED